MYRGHMPWFKLAMESVVVLLALWITLPRRSRIESQRRAFLTRAQAYLDPYFVDVLDADARRVARVAAALLLTGGTFMVFVAGRLDGQEPPAEVNAWLVMVPVVAVGLVVYPILRLRSADRLFQVPGATTAVARPVRVTVSD